MCDVYIYVCVCVFVVYYYDEIFFSLIYDDDAAGDGAPISPSLFPFFLSSAAEKKNVIDCASTKSHPHHITKPLSQPSRSIASRIIFWGSGSGTSLK